VQNEVNKPGHEQDEVDGMNEKLIRQDDIRDYFVMRKLQMVEQR